MAWYFEDDGKQNGPISEEKILGLIQEGRITHGTLVWQAGMTEWCEAGEVLGLLKPPPLPKRGTYSNPQPLAAQANQTQEDKPAVIPSGGSPSGGRKQIKTIGQPASQVLDPLPPDHMSVIGKVTVFLLVTGAIVATIMFIASVANFVG